MTIERVTMLGGPPLMATDERASNEIPIDANALRRRAGDAEGDRVVAAVADGYRGTADLDLLNGQTSDWLDLYPPVGLTASRRWQESAIDAVDRVGETVEVLGNRPAPDSAPPRAVNQSAVNQSVVKRILSGELSHSVARMRALNL